MIISKERFLRQLFAELEGKHLDYFVIGEYQSLPESTGESDIDIAVSLSDAKNLELSLGSVAKNNEVFLVSYYTNSHEIMYRFITLDWGVQVDIMLGGLSYQGTSYYPWENLKKHVILHKGIKVLERDYGFFIGFFKDVIHNGHAKSKYCETLMQAIRINEIAVREEVITCFSADVWEQIRKRKSVDELHNASTQIRQIILRSLKTPLTINALSYYGKLMRRFIQPKPGYVLIVEGTDGSGKSTIINSIIPWLAEGFHKTVMYNHLRPKLLPDIAELFGKRNSAEIVEVVSNPHLENPSGFIGSLFRWIYYLHDYTLGYLVKVWPKIRTRSYVYVFDRYYYDYYIDSVRSRIALPYWLLRLGEAFVPKPDIILCLGGEPDMIYSRKPETSLEEVTRQTEELKRFAGRRNNAFWIDTTQPFDDSIRDAKTAILNLMSTRFKDVL